MNPEIDPETYDFDSFAELRGWRATHARLVEFSAPAEGVAFDAAALVHAAWCLNPRSKPLRQALKVMREVVFNLRACRLLTPNEQKRVRKLFDDFDEWEETE